MSFVLLGLTLIIIIPYLIEKTIKDTRLKKYLLVSLEVIIKNEIVSKQIAVSERILSNAKRIHNRKYSEILVKDLADFERSRCLENGKHFCPMGINIADINLQLNSYIFSEIFDTKVLGIVSAELYDGRYLNPQSGEFTEYLATISTTIENSIWDEYNRLWLKNSFLESKADQRLSQLQPILESNTTISVATLQIFSQSRIIHTAYTQYLNSLKKKDSTYLLDILSNYLSGKFFVK